MEIAMRVPVPLRIAATAALVGATLATVTHAQPVGMSTDDGLRDRAENLLMHGCTVAALHGTYGFSVRGFTDAASGLPPALLGPFAATGTTV
jgi:hypothetical protein